MISKWSLALAVVLLSAAASQAQTTNNPVHDACHADVERVCPDAPPGTDGARKCIKENYAKMSDGCKAALAKAQAASTPAPDSPPK